MRHQDVAVGKRHHRLLQHRAVIPVNRAARRRVRGYLGDEPLLHRNPAGTIIEQGSGLFQNVGDMRLTGNIAFRQFPYCQKSRIVELQPAVAAENGNTFE